MPRHEHRSTPKIIRGYIFTNDAFTGTRVGSLAWFTWLETVTSFYYESRESSFSAHRQRRQRSGSYWIAYRRRAGVLRHCHLGKAQQLTPSVCRLSLGP